MLSSIKLADFLSWFDYSVLFSSLGLTYFLASYGKRTLKSDDSPAGYILMGRVLACLLCRDIGSDLVRRHFWRYRNSF